MADHVIPNLPPGTGLVPRPDLNAAAPSVDEQQVTVAGIGMPIALPFGPNRIGGVVMQPVPFGADLLVPCMIGQGAIESIDSIQLDNKAMPAGVTYTAYLGTAAPTADPWLVSAWAALGKTYADTLPNIAYIVLRVPPGAEFGFEAINIVIKGLKVYDPRDGTQTQGVASTYKYSKNPALHLAYFLSEVGIGPEEALDWTSVGAMATVNDQLCGTEKRRECGLYVNDQQDPQAVEDLLRAHAGCWVVREGGIARFVADAPAASTFSFISGKYRLDSIQLQKRGRASAPTVVTISWTDTTVAPWREVETTVKAAGVDAGITPWIESKVSYPGIQQPGQAKREAVRRLNEFVLCDLSVKFIAMDEGAKVMKGEVFDLTDTEGLSAKPFRCTDAYPTEAGRWQIAGHEYNVGVYSDETVAGPDIPDTTLGNPANPPAVTGLTLTEELYQEKSIGLTKSRIRATWTEPTYPFLLEYRVEVIESGQVIQTDTVPKGSPQYRTPAVQEGKTYLVNVYTMSVTGARNTPPVQASKLSVGKVLPPAFPIGASLDAFEIGGEVIAAWTAALDIDTLRYELRYGAVGGSFAAATFIDKTDTQRARIRGVIPEGDWILYVSAIDSVGNNSSTQLSKPITVTSDAGAFISQAIFSSPTLTDVLAFKLRPDNRQRYITNVAADTVTAQLPNAMSTYTNPIATYRTGSTSKYQSETYDVGAIVAATLVADIDYTDLGGVAVLKIDTKKLIGDPWTTWTASSVRTEFRYTRMSLETTGAFEIRDLPKLKIAAVGRKEFGGPVTSSAVGATTITLIGKYVKAIRINVSPVGTAAREGLINNVVLSTVGANTFEVYLFDAAGTQVASDFLWDFEGIG